jgi:hypothetical protein
MSLTLLLYLNYQGFHISICDDQNVETVAANPPSLQPAFYCHSNQSNNQSFAPDGPSIKKETWVAGKQEGQAGSPSYRRLG